jgi:hypothetical protein
MIASSTRTDFSDVLSPMLVKELRQGLRSRIFMAAFYLTQGLMILCVIFNLVASRAGSNSDSMGIMNGLFWFMISVPLLFFMPMRGFNALHSELKNGTMELVFLSRLSSWRIALGKWLALVVQTILLVTAVLPYVLIRYFLGGIDILDDLRNLLVLLLASATLSALTVAISPYESKILRAIFIIGLIMGFQALFGFVLAWITVGRTAFGGASALPVWKVYLAIAAFLPAFVVLCLEMAAARIAPAAENHAVRKRLIAVYFLLAGCFFTLLGLGKDGEMMSLALMLTAPVVIDALAEPTIFTPSLLRARTKFWRGFGYLVLPGWASAVWFVAAFSVVATIIFGLCGELSKTKDAVGYVAFFGALILPATLIRLFLPTTKHFLAIYMGLQFAFTALTILVGIASQMMGTQILEWLSPLPLAVFFLSIFDQVPGDAADSFLIVTASVTVASLLLLLVCTAAPWRDIGRNLRKAQDSNV